MQPGSVDVRCSVARISRRRSSRRPAMPWICVTATTCSAIPEMYGLTPLAEATGEVGLGALVARAREQLLGGAEFHEPADDRAVRFRPGGQERRHVGHPAGLLEVVGDDDDRQVGDELV